MHVRLAVNPRMLQVTERHILPIKLNVDCSDPNLVSLPTCLRPFLLFRLKQYREVIPELKSASMDTIILLDANSN